MSEKKPGKKKPGARAGLSRSWRLPFVNSRLGT